MLCKVGSLRCKSRKANLTRPAGAHRPDAVTRSSALATVLRRVFAPALPASPLFALVYFCKVSFRRRTGEHLHKFDNQWVVRLSSGMCLIHLPILTGGAPARILYGQADIAKLCPRRGKAQPALPFAVPAGAGSETRRSRAQGALAHHGGDVVDHAERIAALF